MFGKSQNSGVFKKFLSAGLVALLLSAMVPSAAHAINPPPTITGAYQSADIGSTITISGTNFDNGAVVTLPPNATPLSTTWVDANTLTVAVPSYPLGGLTSFAATLRVTNLDSQTAQSTLTYYPSVPAYTTSDVLGGGVLGKTVTLTADNTCGFPLPCYFDSAVTAKIQFGTGPQTTITITPDLVTGTSATLTLPSHTMSAANAADVGHVVIQNPNGYSSTLDFTYYAVPNVSFASPGTLGSPNNLAVGASMTPISLVHTSGYCTNMTPATGSTVIPGVTWNWNSTTQVGSLTGTPTDTAASTHFTATCSNPAGADSVASIYLSASKLPQSVSAFTLSGATGTAPNYTAIFGNTSLAYSFTTSPVSGGGAVSVTSNDACVTVDQLSKTLTIVCVPAGAVTLTATAASTATYDASSPVTVNLTISKATQTIPTFTISGAGGTAPNYTATYGTAGLTYAFTTNPVLGGGAVTVTSSDACVTVDQLAKTLAISCVPTGAVTLTATAASNTNYNGPVTKTVTLTVTQGQLGITFTPILQMIAGGATQDLANNASLTPVGVVGPYAITYALGAGSSSFCSLNGSVVTAISAGNCVVTANAAGNVNMLTAVTQTRTIAVLSAAAQVLTYSGITASYVYGSADVTFHVTDLFGDTLQVTSNIPTTASVTQVNATTFTLHIIQAGNGIISAYDPTTKVRTNFNFSVTPKPVTLVPFMASVAANGTVTFDPATVTGVLAGDFVQVDASQVVGSYGATGQLTWTGVFKLAGSAAQNYTIAAQPLAIAIHPVIFGVTPAFGSPVGGNTVIITGAGFTPNALVSFGTSVATTVHYVNSGTLEVITPEHAVGTTSIVVAMNGVGSVSSPVNFEFKPLAPVIKSVTPGTSITAGGTVIQVDGENFTGQITVTLDGVSVGVQSVTAHRLTFATPAHAAGAVKLTLTNPGLPSVTWTSELLYILPIAVTPPSVTKAWTSGGAKITVSGENFATGITVSVKGVQATNVLVVDPRTLSFTLPLVAGSGLADIVITTAEGQLVTLPGAINFVAAPQAKFAFAAASTVSAKTLAALKKFATQVKKSGLKFASMQVAVYAKAAAPSKVEAKAAKALAKAIRAALATLGIKTRGVNVVSGASGSLKNAVVISGS